jgi:hypothetical protein
MFQGISLEVSVSMLLRDAVAVDIIKKIYCYFWMTKVRL